MTDCEGNNQKFTVFDDGRPVDCYIKIGRVDDSNHDDFKHLEIGDICFIDLTVTSKTSEARGLELSFQLIRQYIEDGSSIDSAIKVMTYQRYNPQGIQHDDTVDLRGSICDYVGRYLEGLK